MTIWTTTDCIFPLQFDVDCPFSSFDHCDRPKFLGVVRDLVVFRDSMYHELEIS